MFTFYTSVVMLVLKVNIFHTSVESEYFPHSFFHSSEMFYFQHGFEFGNVLFSVHVL